MKKLALSKTRLGFVGFLLPAWMLISPPSRGSVEQWAKAYGGTGNDRAYSIQHTSDGGYIVAGTTDSFSAGGIDIWVLKLDAKGNIQWQKTYGGGGDDEAYYIQQTSDGSYIVAGTTKSFGAGENDVWVLKLDAKGNVQWQKTYGGRSWDGAYSIQQTKDGGYILAGATKSFGAGGYDVWVLKLDAKGNIQWQKTYGGSGEDYAYSIQHTSDSGYIVAGATESFGAGDGDFWVLKLDANGNVQWQKTYGGREGDEAYSIQQIQDGGYIVAGATDSFGAGNGDVWVLKLDAKGDVQWQKAYGEGENDYANSIQQTRDGGYIVAGATRFAGDSNVWVLKLDAKGNVQWQEEYGGIHDDDEAYFIQQTQDGGYIVAGWTDSFSAGKESAWVLKLDARGNIANCPILGISRAMVSDTSVVGKNTNAAVLNTSGISKDTNATINSTTASTTQICYASTKTFKLSQWLSGFWGILMGS